MKRDPRRFVFVIHLFVEEELREVAALAERCPAARFDRLLPRPLPLWFKGFQGLFDHCHVPFGGGAEPTVPQDSLFVGAMDETG